MTVSGTVTDSTGAPVNMAVVYDDHGNAANTIADGSYVLESFLGAQLTAEYNAIGYGGKMTQMIDGPIMDFPGLFEVPEVAVITKKRSTMMEWLLLILIALLVYRIMQRIG